MSVKFGVTESDLLSHIPHFSAYIVLILQFLWSHPLQSVSDRQALSTLAALQHSPIPSGGRSIPFCVCTSVWFYFMLGSFCIWFCSLWLVLFGCPLCWFCLVRFVRFSSVFVVLLVYFFILLWLNDSGSAWFHSVIGCPVCFLTIDSLVCLLLCYASISSVGSFALSVFFSGFLPVH